MNAQPQRRRISTADDPWGFGESDGTLVEVRHDQPPEPVDPNASPTAAFERAPQATTKKVEVVAERERVDYGDDISAPWPRAAGPDRHDVTVVPRPAVEPADHAGDAQLHPPPVVAADPRYFQTRGSRRPSPTLTGAVVALVIAAGFVWLRAESARSARALTDVGTFVLSSQPPGAAVTLDGVPAGVTPLALQLRAGAHDIVATGPDGMVERLSADVPPGTSSSRHLMFTPPASTPATAPSAAATPDGAARQAASALATSAAAPAPAAAAAPPVPARGFVTFSLPFDVQVYEAGSFMGSNSGERISVRPGTHTFTLVNEPLGFRSEETVIVKPGASVRRVVEQRTASLSVNALPWAEVLISGRSYGETPLANITLPIGVYRVTLRHPTLGDREVPVTVRLGAPNRVAVDLRR